MAACMTEKENSHCSLCKIQYSNIRYMSCGHLICEDCLETMVRLYAITPHCIYCSKDVKICDARPTQNICEYMYICLFGNVEQNCVSPSPSQKDE